MGPYCRYCDHRCFVLRVLPGGEQALMATCKRGMERDLLVAGHTHRTASNPITGTVDEQVDS